MPREYYIPQQIIPLETTRIAPLGANEQVSPLYATIGDATEIDNAAPFFRVSEAHGRSICAELPPDQPAVDEYGYLFTIRSIKGTVLTDILDPEQDPEPPASRREALLAIWPKGLIELASPEDIHTFMAASDAYRARGLLTEWSQSAHQITTITIDGQTVDIHSQLAKLAAHRRNWLLAQPIMRGYLPEVLLPVLDKYEQRLNNSTLYVLERYLPVAERITDLLQSRTIEEICRRLQPARQWTARQRITRPEIPKFPDINSKPGLRGYFTDWLPYYMGTYLGTLHQTDTAHGAAHDQNWMTIAALADCDSTRGKMLGQPPPEDALFIKDRDDAQCVFDAMEDSAPIQELCDYIFDPDLLRERFLDAYEGTICC